MFELARKETFKEKVTVQVKTDGGWREEHFIGIFKRTTDERQRELVAMPFNDVLDEVLVGWEMKDMERNSVEFTPENLAALKSLPGASRDTVLAYINANSGAKQKN
ncbi:hypothetical protein GL58_18750 [Comamonas testosteroni]|uniref:Uncharacterized protein n=1 Tax=Comamonas testosteroni TaxID=285 RepID=A0A0L7MBJ3_COMTE|nr:hypothetical protein [Comamonas testosteroni]KOC19246.1 hypothetical protein GL58_18750 [Comamonas testosteroni]KWT72892.1 hypothetical protein APV28_1456 [Comamonas testosteroni]